MKLHYSAASSFVRKVRVTAMECGFTGKLTLLATHPHQSTPELVAPNRRNAQYAKRDSVQVPQDPK